MISLRNKILEENPFSLEFDYEKLNNFIKENNLENEDKNIIEFAFTCHKLYKKSYTVFIEIFEA
jgi:hypothetical protein